MDIGIIHDVQSLIFLLCNACAKGVQRGATRLEGAHWNQYQNLDEMGGVVVHLNVQGI